MTLHIYDIEDLHDISDTLVFEEEPTLFEHDHAVELIESALHLMEEYVLENPSAISEPNFENELLEEIKELFYIQFENEILESDFVEDDLNQLLEEAFAIYTTTFQPQRSIQQPEDDDENENNEANEEHDEDNEQQNKDKENKEEQQNKDKEAKIQRLREIPQPVQRTPEWYKFRWNLITASNAWKAFESQSAINQLIFEKCQPLKDFTIPDTSNDEVKMVNTTTTLHWGQKYEPLSVMMYEHMYDSSVEDFGCIQHPRYSFIGASPDGIIIRSNTGRYGRMLEIKNIVNREINGIPKKEYWIQMQLQMEVCDLDECDFLETKFVEYPDQSSYMKDSSTSFVDGKECNSRVTTADGSYKGIIVHFHKKDGTPYYEYMPLHLWKPSDIAEWEENTIHRYESEPFNYIFIKFIYWKLEKLSCVLVSRNKEWFNQNVHKLENVWKTIEKERISGYEHRAPNRKPKKEYSKSYSEPSNDVCFLKVVKL